MSPRAQRHPSRVPGSPGDRAAPEIVQPGRIDRDEPMSADRGDSGYIAAGDHGGARALAASAPEVLLSGQRPDTRRRYWVAGFQARHGLPGQAIPSPRPVGQSQPAGNDSHTSGTPRLGPSGRRVNLTDQPG